jgi:hypothetical protein
LLELREHSILKGFEFKLMNVTTQIHRVLEISCLTTVFDIVTERNLANGKLPNGFARVLQSAPCA